jgi:hypothetical protein
MQNRFNFFDFNDGKIMLEYDLMKPRLFYKVLDSSVEFKQYADIEELNKTVAEMKTQWEKEGYKLTNEGFHDDTEAPIFQKMFDKLEKDSKLIIKKEDNPYKKMDKEKIKKEYFGIANNELPEILSEGFVKAIQKYKKAKSDDNEICCILDINKKSKMVFVYGDGEECENADDENVFFKHPIDETLYKCKSMVEAIDTLNLSQESSHWLSDAIITAKEQSIFKDLSITIYGNVQYGEHELDVIYEN